MSNRGEKRLLQLLPVRLEKEQMQEFKKVAAKKNLSASELVRKLVKLYLESRKEGI